MVIDIYDHNNQQPQKKQSFAAQPNTGVASRSSTSGIKNWETVEETLSEDHQIFHILGRHLENFWRYHFKIFGNVSPSVFQENSSKNPNSASSEWCSYSSEPWKLNLKYKPKITKTYRAYRPIVTFTWLGNSGPHFLGEYKWEYHWLGTRRNLWKLS